MVNEWKCPNVTIGGLPIPEQEFTWALTAGPRPYITDFWIPMSDYEKFLALSNPVTIQWEVTGGVRGEPEFQIITFKNAWLLTPARIDNFQCIWRIADARWYWQGKKMSFCYNKTRIKNEVGKVVSPNEVTPAKLREPYDTFAQGRYIPWTVKADGKPYSIKEILEREFAILKIPTVKWTGQDLSFILENLEMEGEDIYRGITHLLDLGRMNISINPDGEAYFYSLFSYDYNQENILTTHIANLMKTQPGIIYKQNKRKIRPFAVDIHFEKKIETWFTVGEISNAYPASEYKKRPVVGIAPLNGVWSRQDIDERRVIGIINVIQAPLPVIIDGKKINIGEWVPLHKFLAAYGIDEDFVRTGYFSGLMETKLQMKLVADLGIAYDQAKRIACHVAGAIKESYRQIFMIEPYWMDRISHWETRRVSVINNYDRYSPISPLFADYCVIPYLRDPVQAKGLATWNTEVYNWLVDTEDPIRQKPTPGTVQIMNQPLGIFRISYPSPMDQTTYTIVPFALDVLPFPAVNASAPFLKNSKPRPSYTLNTILSVVWSVDAKDSFLPNGKLLDRDSKYFSIPVGFGQEGERDFHPIEYYSRVEYARYAVDSILPANYSFLQALSYSEAARMMIGFKDFFAGTITGAGYVPAKCVGNINSIVYSFSPASGLETTIDMRDSLPVPMLEHNLKQEYIDFLRKHISRVDNANESMAGGI